MAKASRNCDRFCVTSVTQLFRFDIVSRTFWELEFPV
jgi:hypothetical protein